MNRSLLKDTTLGRRTNFDGVRIAVEYVALDSLKPPKRQVRRRSREQMAKIARSITEFGFLNPIIVDEESRIVAGSGRWEASALLGLTSIPVIRTEHLTEAQLRLFAIADNKLPEGARWEEGALLLELNEIEILEPEIDLTGSAFAIAELDTIYGRQRTNELSDCDELEAIPPAPVSRLGDQWRLGRHLLGCGDARDQSFLASLLGEAKARILLSDPPWNLKIEGVVSGNGRKKHVDFVMAAGEMTKSEFVDFLGGFLATSQTALIEGALLYVFMDWRNLDALQAAALSRGLEQKNLLVWCKDNAGMGLLYRSQHELIALYKHGSAPHLNNVRLGEHGRNRSNVLLYPGANSFGRGRDAALAAHPTSKPVSLLADIILDTTAPGDLVLDPFGGSGSTLIAAEKTARRACLIELDPIYVDGIIGRYQKLAGEPVVHVEDGRTFDDIADERLAAGEAQ